MRTLKKNVLSDRKQCRCALSICKVQNVADAKPPRIRCIFQAIMHKLDLDPQTLLNSTLSTAGILPKYARIFSCPSTPSSYRFQRLCNGTEYSTLLAFRFFRN